MENETNTPKPSNLLGELQPTYSKLVEALNQVRVMLWAWDNERAATTVRALEQDYRKVMIEARRSIANASPKGREPVRRLKDEVAEVESHTSKRDAEVRLLYSMRFVPPEGGIPHFVLGGVVQEFDRIKETLNKRITGIEPRQQTTVKDIPTTPDSTMESDVYHYRFTSRPDRQFEMRAYAINGQVVTYDVALESLNERFNEVVRLDSSDSASDYIIRLAGPGLLADISVVDQKTVSVMLTALQEEFDPSDIFDMIASRLIVAT